MKALSALLLAVLLCADAYALQGLPGPQGGAPVAPDNTTINASGAGGTLQIISLPAISGSNLTNLNASNLVGTTLNSSVVNSSLTSVGTLANLTVTNPISGIVTGSAATLTTPRAINGVNFDGSAAITVPAAAATLTGTTLAAGVTASSLTSFGSSPTFVTPILGTPTSGTLTNCTFPTLNQNTTGSAATLTAGALTDAMVSGTAAIAGTKITPDFGAQSITSSANVFHLGPTTGSWPNLDGTPTNASYPNALIRSNQVGNVLSVQQLSNTGFSAINFGDDTGQEHAAIGWGNSGASSPYGSTAFFESHSANGTLAPLALVSSFQYLGANNTLYRASWQSDGSAHFFDNTSNGSVERILLNSSGASITGLNGMQPTGATKFFSVDNAGTHVLSNDFSVLDAAGTGGRINFFDANACIYGREGANNVLNYYDYGGTLAGNNGHSFYTGGVKASQTLRARIADDGAKFTVPLTVTNSTAASVPLTINGASSQSANFVEVKANNGNKIAGVTNAGVFSGQSGGSLSVYRESDGAIAGGIYCDGAASLNINSSQSIVLRQNALLLGTVQIYNNVSTAGSGVPAIYGSGRLTSQTAAAASVTSYTVGGSDSSFLVSANVNIVTGTAFSFTTTCAYTDEGNTSRTLTFPMQTSAGAISTTIANASGTGAYSSQAVRIRAKSGTAITIATTGTFTTVNYNVEGDIIQVK